MPTVFLIEDDAESRRTTAELFAREDWEILEAGDGESGIRLALEHKPELILCDLLMPKTNGFQVCRSIRQHSLPTKIIIISGPRLRSRSDERDRRRGRRILVKPIRWEISARSDRTGVAAMARMAHRRTNRCRNSCPPSTRVQVLGRARLDSRPGIFDGWLRRQHELHRSPR